MNNSFCTGYHLIMLWSHHQPSTIISSTYHLSSTISSLYHVIYHLIINHAPHLLIGIFMLLIFTQGLAWEFSAETISILLVEVSGRWSNNLSHNLPSHFIICLTTYHLIIWSDIVGHVFILHEICPHHLWWVNKKIDGGRLIISSHNLPCHHLIIYHLISQLTMSS